MKSLTLTYICLLCSFFGFSQRIKKDKISIFYKTNHYSLTIEQKEELKNFIAYYKNTKINKIVIVSSTDFIGDSNYNLNLSKKRANLVADYIKYYDDFKVKIKFIGEQKNPFQYLPKKGIPFSFIQPS